MSTWISSSRRAAGHNLRKLLLYFEHFTSFENSFARLSFIFRALGET